MTWRKIAIAVPYLWLLVFFIVPMASMALTSLQTGSLGTGYEQSWNFSVYPEMVERWSTQLIRSFQYALTVTGLALVIGYPVAYTIAFRGGRYKNILLLRVILPFFTAFVIRTLNRRLILADNGFVFGPLKELGIFNVDIRLDAEHTGAIRVWVVETGA